MILMKKDVPFGTRPIITNIVATGRFPHDVDIVKAYGIADFVHAEYNPETYPALLVKVMVGGERKHVTIYKNGKYIITGAKSEKELNEVYDEVIRILKENGL
jgi:TATA-box binding protein (TBP) (component of TFIID and TFIIIB)